MNRYLSKIWLAVVTFLIVTLIALIPNVRINSNLFDLLPSQEQAQYSYELVDAFTEELDQQLIWLVSSDNDVKGAAKYWVDLLSQTKGIENIAGQKTPELLLQWAQITLKFATLMPKNIREKMTEGDYPTWVISQVYSPFSGISVGELSHDPMLLMRSFVLEQMANNGQFSMSDGWITVKNGEGKEWILIRATVDPAYQGMLDKKALVQNLEKHQQSLLAFDHSATLLKKGSVYFADFAIKTAEKDISTIGIISTLGVILIFLWLFRSLHAIGSILIALAIGLLAGTVTVLLIYGEIHIITIVMSTSIIGVAIDYALLFLTSRMLLGDQYSVMETLDQTKKPLLGALMSTLLAYCVLLFAPFAGLTQLAIFTMSGLIAVFLTVTCWFPVIGNIKTRQSHLSKVLDQCLAVLDRSKLYRKILPIMLLGVALLGITQLSHNDDIGRLQALPPQLVSEDQRIGGLLQQSSSTQVLMVTGKTQEEVLQNLEKSYPVLDQWLNDEVIESYQAFPFQSAKWQKENQQILQKTATALQQKYDDEEIEVTIPSFSGELISTQEWLDSPLSEGWSLLWKTLPNGESAIIVSLSKVLDVAKLMQNLQSQEHLHWVDRKTEISDLFSQYRAAMEWLLFIAVVGISLLFIAFKGIQQGIKMSIPVVLAVLLPLGMMGFLGITLNLFNVLALILVVGMSIDYVLFFSSSQQESRHIALLTIAMAAIISELTFGLLAMSGTNAIAGFGLMLLLGILTALLLSPLAIDKRTL